MQAIRKNVVQVCLRASACEIRGVCVFVNLCVIVCVCAACWHVWRCWPACLPLPVQCACLYLFSLGGHFVVRLCVCVCSGVCLCPIVPLVRIASFAGAGRIGQGGGRSRTPCMSSGGHHSNCTRPLSPTDALWTLRVSVAFFGRGQSHPSILCKPGMVGPGLHVPVAPVDLPVPVLKLPVPVRGFAGSGS